MSTLVHLQDFQKRQQEKTLFNRWISYYKEQPHEELLEALVYEHEHDFPLRRSNEVLDQMKHKALVEVLQLRAQTQFLKSFLDEINQSKSN